MMLGFGAFDAILAEIFHGAHADRFWLAPTAEVPLTNLYNGQIVDETALPIRMTADTPVFSVPKRARRGKTRAA